MPDTRVSNTLEQICSLVGRGAVEISMHAARELLADNIAIIDVLASVAGATRVEDYPDHSRGPCVLVLQYDSLGVPFHALWGIRRYSVEPAVLVTAYRPDPVLWENGFRARRL